MKKLILFFATAAILAASCTNNAELRTLQGRIDHIENRQQLKALVDTFSVLADVKDTDTQGLLFTEDGVMKTMQNGVEVFRVNGRENIVKACAVRTSSGTGLAGKRGAGGHYRSILTSWSSKMSVL